VTPRQPRDGFVAVQVLIPALRTAGGDEETLSPHDLHGTSIFDRAAIVLAPLLTSNFVLQTSDFELQTSNFSYAEAL
jgi:hypothetical protein